LDYEDSMAKKDVKGYKAETTSSFLNFLSEALNYGAVIATMIITASLSIFMDLINSTCNFLRAAFTTFLAKRLQKNLKFKYNYGTAKLETLSMIFCDFLLALGTLFVLGFAIYQLCIPREANVSLLAGVILKAVNCSADFWLSVIGYRVYKKTKTKVAKSSFEASLGCLGFDLAIFLSVFTSFLFTNWDGVIYIEPIASIIIAVFIIYKAIRRISIYVKELVDVTIDEKDQLKIDNLLSKYFDKYKEFYSVNTHKVGEEVFVDFCVSFAEETTYSEIKNTLKLFTEELENSFSQCNVSLIIRNNKTKF